MYVCVYVCMYVPLSPISVWSPAARILRSKSRQVAAQTSLYLRAHKYSGACDSQRMNIHKIGTGIKKC